ncbi:MAG TPA: OmpA family protein [Deltaproteobacteria bacterium]|nr:OmpA family protein [Deltaproteobacteria bacterium]HIJ40654.1 OmpA family protein [Deltaproteobacteria bacterium]
MRNRAAMGVIVLAFVFSSMFWFASCAKKQVDTLETKPKTETGEGSVDKGSAAGKQSSSETITELSEAERRAKQQEMEIANKMAVFESENVYFEFDKSDLTPEAQAILKKKAAFLQQNPNLALLIEGNCDQRGTIEYNLALGERRANAAQRFLMALGISEDRLKTISYGKERLADPANNPVAWSLNRRDSFKLLR